MKFLRFPLFWSLLIMVGACGSSTSDVAVEVAEGGNAPSEETSGAQEAAENGDGEGAVDPWEEYTSPIQEFLGIDRSNFNDEDFEAQMVEFERKAQESITMCMRELGWEYQPTSQGAGSVVFDAVFEDGGLEYGSKQWVAKYGFGITTQAFSQGQVGPDLVGYDDSQVQMMDEAMEDDPNQAYVEGLSESEQEAYSQDLFGQEPDFDDTLTEEEQDEFWQNYEPTGCQGEAYSADVFGGPEQEFYEAFGGDLEEMYERVSADPRIVAEQQKLVDCLAGKGQSISADEDPWQQFYEMFEDELEPLFQSDSFGDPFEGRDPESMTEEEINDVLAAMDPSGPELDAVQLSTLADLQQRELELAADVLDCEPEFFSGGGQGELFFEVLAEYEQEFLDANAGALSEFEGSGSE